MRKGSLLMAWLGLGLSLPAAAAQRVAVVVALSDYGNLPDALNLPTATADATSLSTFLDDRGGYDQVFTLTDASATREALRDLLFNKLAPTLQPGDTLMWVFAGHGFGGDFGNPYLLMYDSLIEEPSTAIDLYAFTRDLSRRTPGVNLVVALDAAHAGDVDGTALIGPNAKDLADLPGTFFAVSGAGPREVLADGTFLPILQAGLQGRADDNKDGVVGAGEIHRYVLDAVTRSTKEAAHPVESGRYDPSLVVAVAGGRSPLISIGGGDTEGTEPDGPALKYGGPISYGLMGGGLLVAGSSALVGNLRGRALCDVADGKAVCTSLVAQERYERVRLLTNGGYAAGAVIAATGVGLGFVPLSDGAMLTADLRF